MTHNSLSGRVKTYVLIHGAWHGAWCWNKVIPLIQAYGHKAVAIDLPGHGENADGMLELTLEDYVSAIMKAVNDQNGEVILVGHSMAGIPISQAAEKLPKGKISALVYVDAFLPKDGDTLFALVETTLKNLTPDLGRPLLVENIIVSPDQKTNWVNPDMAGEIFYHDCTEKDRQYALSRITKEFIAPLATPVRLTNEIYGTIPKYFILCTQTKDMNKTFLSTRVPCKKVYRLASSHSPFFSMPEKLVEIFDEVG